MNRRTLQSPITQAPWINGDSSTYLPAPRWVCRAACLLLSRDWPAACPAAQRSSRIFAAAAEDSEGPTGFHESELPPASALSSSPSQECFGGHHQAIRWHVTSLMHILTSGGPCSLVASEPLPGPLLPRMSLAHQDTSVGVVGTMGTLETGWGPRSLVLRGTRGPRPAADPGSSSRTEAQRGRSKLH